MMKRLLGSTAILSALVFSGGAANAAAPAMAAPKLTISGQSTFNAWWFGQDEKEIQPIQGNECDYIGKGRGYLFTVDDSRLKFDITGKTDPGMDYGFTIIIDGNTEKTSHDKTIKENYLFFGGSWGKLTMGDTDGVEDTMAFYGGDALGGTGGFDGNFDRVVNFTTGSVHSVDLVGDTSKSTKIIYHTPRWKGFQAGVSYTPRTEHRGEQHTDTLRSYKTPKRQPYDTHSIAGGLNFINKFNNGFEMALSGTVLFGDTRPPCSKLGNDVLIIPGVDGPNVVPLGASLTVRNKFENTAAFALGYLLSYKGFEWGGEFGWNGDSHEAKHLTYTDANGAVIRKGAKDSWFIDTGLGYTWGATKVSAGYYYGQRKAIAFDPNGRGGLGDLDRETAKTHIFTTSLDHKLAPGVGVFFEYAHYNMDNDAAATDAAVCNATSQPSTKYFGVRDNKANAFVVGTKIVF